MMITVVLLLAFGSASSFLAFGSASSFFKFAKGQQQPTCFNETIQRQSSNGTILPVILLHGYDEGPSVWSTWEGLLQGHHIPFCTVSFSQTSQSFDQCGSAADHARELGSIINLVKNKTQSTQVNIVAHSKGGLDARVYLDNSHTKDVAKLIMIGTPNAGDPIEDQLNLVDQCTPAADDLKTDAADTMARENNHTQYYTIVGNWSPPATFSIPYYVWFNPDLSWNLFDQSFSPTTIPPNCPQQKWLEFEIRGYTFLTVVGFTNNDGIVPRESVLSLPNSTNIGSTDDCHTNLLSEKSFSVAEPYLLGSRR